MTPPTFRPVAALALAAGLVFALPGCGSKPQADKGSEKKDEPKGEPKPDPKVDPKGEPKIDPKGEPKPVDKIDLSTGVGKEATEFLKALGEGTAKADKLSAGFAKAIGLPVTLPSDKAKGYSADAAEGWLKRVGQGHNISLPFNSRQAGDAALFRGTFIGKPGGYALRMVKEGGAWKVDWLALSSAEVKGTTAGPSADAVAQEFAATAVIEVICDKDAMPKDDRIPAIAAGLTPALRAKWAEPFGSDKDQGYDYNRGKLALKAAEIGGGAESFTATQQGDTPVFKVEITKAGGAKAAYLVKLVKGTAPGQWLVDDITPA
jgi:hypothetical protein